MTTQHLSTAPAPQPVPPQVYLSQLAFGASITQALYVAAKLGIADLLAAGPQPVSRLAMDTKTHERSLYRVLRSLAGIGVFQETEPKVFALTPYADALRSDAPNSFRNAAIFMGEEFQWSIWSHTLYSVQTGQSGWSHVHGAEAFDSLDKHSAQAEIFNRAMTDMTVAVAPAIVEACDFSGFATVADIAGGYGYLLAQILKANPHLKGLLFDMPTVVAGAGALLEKEGVAARVNTVGGSFFEAVPAGADAYLMKHIIHDWNDERASNILRNIRAAMPDHGKLLIVESVVPPGNEPHQSKVLDLSMLVMAGGAERTAGEYLALLAAVGLRLTRIIPTLSPLSIIEAVKDDQVIRAS